MENLTKFLRFNRLSIKKRLQVLTFLFVLVIGVMVGYTALSLSQQAGDGLIVNIAGRQRMLTQKFIKEFILAVQLSRGNESRFNKDNFEQSKQLFDVSLQALMKGGTTYSDLQMSKPVALPKADMIANEQLAEVATLWDSLQKDVDNFSLAEYQPEQLEIISTHSLKVLASMNKAVVMLANASDDSIQVMQRNQVIGSIIALCIGVFLSSLIAKSITLPLKLILDSTVRISRGDLKKYVGKVNQKNELGYLTNNVELMRKSLHDIINLVQQNSRQMAHSAQQVSTVSAEIALSSEEQKIGSGQVHSAITLLLESSAEVSDRIESTKNLSQDARKLAEQGIAVVHQSIEQLSSAVDCVNITATQLSELKEFTLQISEISESINNIAEQTNLLALNAAIEAARAGEQGRGFAVVADEVRNLAARTSSSSNKITDLIAQLTTKVDGSAESMQDVVDNVNQSQQFAAETVASFASVKEGVTQTTESAMVISDFNEKQVVSLQKLDTKLNDLLTVLTESTDKSSTTSMVAGDLYQISELLERQLQGFETEAHDVVEVTAEEKRKFPRVDNIVRVTLSQNDIKADGLTLDLSMQGLKVRCATKFDKELPVKIEVYQPSTSEGGRNGAFELVADLVHSQWVDDCYHYGLKFSGLGLSDARNLEAIFKYFKKPYRYSQAS